MASLSSPPNGGEGDAAPPPRKRARDIAVADAFEAIRTGAPLSTGAAALVALAGLSDRNHDSPADRMAWFDRLPKELRDLANEYGHTIVAMCTSAGIRDARSVRAQAETELRAKALESEAIYSRPMALR